MILTIIIPVFNEEKTIKELLKRVVSVTLPNITKEIIVINDASTDLTHRHITASLKKYPEIIYLSHKKNLGKGAAVRSGIKKAKGKYIIIQDADLEYHPKDIALLLAPIQQKKAEVVYGTRLRRLPHLSQEESNPLFLLHYVGNRTLSLITSVLYAHWITDMETCYKLFPRKVMRTMTLRSKGFEFEPEITAKLLKRKYKIVEVPISTIPRKKNEGKKLRTVRDGTLSLVALIKYRFSE